MERIQLEMGSGTKPREIQIQSEKLLGEGAYGTAYVVEATLEKDGKTRPLSMVVKKYHPEQESFARRSMENYKLLKKAGLPVFRTFRLDSVKKQIVMTNGNSDTRLCLGSNKNTSSVRNFSEYGREVIPETSDIEGLTRRVFNDAIKAAEAGIKVTYDMLFFLVDRKYGPDISYVFADLDILDQNNDKSYLRGKNVFEMNQAINRFVRENMSDRASCLKRVSEIFVEFGGQLPPPLRPAGS